MIRKPKQKGAIVSQRLIADIPEPVFKALKIRAAETDMAMKDIITEALRRYLSVKEGGERGKKGEA
jgi:plasmid stability protein